MTKAQNEGVKETGILASISIEELIEATDAIVVGLDSNGDIQLVNGALEKVSGFKRRKLVGRNWFETLVPVDRFPNVQSEFKRLLESGEPSRFENAIKTKSGEERYIVWRNTVIRRDGKAAGTISFGIDLTESRRIEEDLRDSEEKLLAVFMSAPIAIAVSGLEDGVFYDVNREFERMFEWKYDEAVGKTSPELGMCVDPADRTRAVDALVNEGESEDVELSLRSRSGKELIVRSSARLLTMRGHRYLITALSDITARKQAEEQLAILAEQMNEAQKMEAVGRLAGGVAHNFNNILTAIVGYCELLLAKLPRDSEYRNDAEQIKIAADNAAVVTRQLLLFSRRKSGNRASLDLNAVVVETKSLLRQLIRGKIEMVTALSPDLPLVEVDRSQIEQVLVDLVLNASDAMPEGGTLTIATDSVERPGELLQDGLFAPARGFVTLAVSDTGIGMDEKTKALLFEPFFTTKGPDWGTGLGLATVYGIVEDSGGYIEVESAPGKGATFTIFLPASTGVR